MSKLVYLDSSDFSNLSAPEAELSAENLAILSTLRQHKQAGTAKFFMSAVHFSEAVHAAAAHKLAAVRRAALMRELCESNLLRYPTELPRLELRKALLFEKKIRLSVEEITSQNGEWFGVETGLDNIVEARQDLDRKINERIENLPRRERRKWRSQFSIGKKSSHAKWRQLIQSGTAPSLLEFPLTLLSQEVTIDWFLGVISDADFKELLLQIMRDPYAMFKYLLDETKRRETFYEILRKQGRELAQNLKRTTEAMLPALQFFANQDVEFNLNALIDEVCSKPDFLRHCITTYSEGPTDHIVDADLAQIVESCPSLFTFAETSKAYFLSSATAHLTRVRAGNLSAKDVDPSDFGDLMHCFYVPYFDVFRCDVRFGAHLKKQKAVRARIADRIGDLLCMLPAVPSVNVGSNVA